MTGSRGSGVLVCFCALMAAAAAHSDDEKYDSTTRVGIVDDYIWILMKLLNVFCSNFN